MLKITPEIIPTENDMYFQPNKQIKATVKEEKITEVSREYT